MNTHPGIKADLFSMDDVELVRRCVEGDTSALYVLILHRYKKKLKSVLTGFFPHGYSDYDLEEWLNDFYYDLTFRRRNEKSRFEGYDATKPFESYVSVMLHHWAIDRWRKINRERGMNLPLPDFADAVLGDEDESGDMCVSGDETVSAEEQATSMLLALEYLPKLVPRDRYIVLTYLLCECYKDSGMPLYLSKRLAEQLGMSESAVKMAYKRGLEKLRKTAKKSLDDGVTF